MRRDRVNLEVANVSWIEEDGDPRQPILVVRVEEDVSAFRRRIGGEDGSVDADDVDVTFRFQGKPEDATGVMALTDRMTGEFVLEVNTPGTNVIQFVSAARRFAEQTGEDARFRARVLGNDMTLIDMEKRTLLVYSEDGELLRQYSLIPSGVEI